MNYQDALALIEATDYNKAYAENQTYWCGNGLFQDIVNELTSRIPFSGECEKRYSANKLLDRYRRANNCAYDLYNNGLCNRASAFAKLFGFSGVSYRRYDGRMSESVYARTEQALDKVMIEAAREQGLLS